MRGKLPLRAVGSLSIVLPLAIFAGCESARTLYYLPYQFPAATAAASNNRATVMIGTVTDNRNDHTLDMFLNEYPADFLRKALAAELSASGGFAHVLATTQEVAGPAYRVDANFREVSWATPDRDGISRTLYGATLATGGVGGLLYGASGTPVFSHVVIDLRVTELTSNRVLLDETFETLHRDHVAKLKVDDLEPRARILAVAIKEDLLKIAGAVSRAVSGSRPK